MNITDVIEKKKNGNRLSKSDIDFFINGVMDGSVKDYQISSLLMAVCINGMTESESVDLTMAMARSGDTLTYPENITPLTVDKHSTGGVGDSVTFVIMPIIACLGLYMPKLSGRGLGVTGGTIDKLEAIPGIKTELDYKEFMACLIKNGGVICGQTSNLAPADKILYAIRDTSGTVDSIPLIASSIMSKKIAAGAVNIVLDIKVGKGAFMKNTADAERLGRLMKSIGSQCGRNVSYLLTNMDCPLSNYVGNSLEIYGALRVLRGEKNNLYRITKALIEKALDGMPDIKGYDIDEIIDSGKALEKFRNIISDMGGDISYVDNPDKLMPLKPVEYRADRSGYIGRIDAGLIGKAVAEMGGGRKNKSDTVDPYVGVILPHIGSYVSEGQTIASIYRRNESDDKIFDTIKYAIKIDDNKPNYELIMNLL